MWCQNYYYPKEEKLFAYLLSRSSARDINIPKQRQF